MIWIITSMRGKIESYRETLLSCFEICLVELIWFFDCWETCVLTNGPWTSCVHSCIRPSLEWEDTWKVWLVWILRPVIFCIHWLDKHLFVCLAYKCLINIFTAKLFGCQLFPLFVQCHILLSPRCQYSEHARFKHARRCRGSSYSGCGRRRCKRLQKFVVERGQLQ